MGKQNNSITYLSESDYDKKLDSELSTLIDKGYSDDDIRLYGDDFKSKYAVKKKVDTQSTTPTQKLVLETNTGSLGGVKFPKYNPNEYNNKKPIVKQEVNNVVRDNILITPKVNKQTSIENIQKQNEDFKKLTKKIVSETRAKTNVPDEEKELIKKEVDDVASQTGISNNIKAYGKKAWNTILDTGTLIGSYGRVNKAFEPLRFDEDPLSSEKKEVKETLIKQGLKPTDITTDLIIQKAKELKTEKLIQDVKQSKINDYMETMSDQDKSYFEIDRTQAYKTISDNDKKLLGQYQIKEKTVSDMSEDFKKQKSDYEKAVKNNTVSQEQVINLQNTQKKLIEEVNDLRLIDKKYTSNYKELGTVEEELDIAKRKYGTTENILGKIGLATGDMVLNAVSALDYVSTLGGLIDDENSDIAALQIQKGKDVINKERETLRKSIGTINNVEDLMDFTTDTLAEQIPNLALAYFTGGASAVETTGAKVIGSELMGASAMASTSLGEEYQNMKISNIRGDKKYNAFQLALTPLTYFGSELAENIFQIKLLKQSSRAFNSAISDEIGKDLFKKSFTKKAMDFGFKPVKNLGKEIGYEELTTLGQNWANINIKQDPNARYSDNMLETLQATLVTGGVLSFAPHIISSATQIARPKRDNVLLDNNAKKLIELSVKIKQDEITPESKVILQREIDDISKQSENIIKESISKIKEMPKQVFNKLLDLETQSSNIRAEVDIIVNDKGFTKQEKQDRLNVLKEKYKISETQRNEIITGNVTAFDILPDNEKIKIKDIASRELIKEQNPDGKKSIKLDDIEITERANKIYSKQLKDAETQSTVTNETQPEAQVQKPTEAEKVATPEVEDVVAPIVEEKGNISQNKSENDLLTTVNTISLWNEKDRTKLRSLATNETTLSKSEMQELSELRGKRDNYIGELEKQLQSISTRYRGATDPESFNRQDRQQWGLLQRELQVVNKEGTGGKQKEYSQAELQREGISFDGIERKIQGTSRYDNDKNKEGDDGKGSNDNSSIEADRKTSIQRNVSKEIGNEKLSESNTPINRNLSIRDNTDLQQGQVEAVQPTSNVGKGKENVEVNPNEQITELSKTENLNSSKKKKTITDRALRGNDDIVIQAIQDYGMDLDYETESQEIAKNNAKKFVDKVGLNNAINALKNKSLKGAEKAFVYRFVIDELSNTIKELKADDSNLAQAEIYSKEYLDLLGMIQDEFDKESRDSGRFISALQEVYKSSKGRFNLEKEIEFYKAKNGGKISDEQLNELVEAHNKIKELEEKYDALFAEKEKLDAQIAVDNIVEAISRKTKANTNQTITSKKKAKALADKIRSLKVHKDTSIATPISLAFDSALEIIAVSIETTGKIADAIKLGVDYIKKQKLEKTDEDSLIDDIINAFNAENEVKPLAIGEDGRLQIPNSLIYNYVENGITDIDVLAQTILNDFKSINPDLDITLREVRDAITKYGKQINPTQDEVLLKIGEMNRLGRLISSIEDARQGNRPSRTGLVRPKQTLDERRLMTTLKELLRDIPMDDADISKKWKTALDSVKTRLNNEIENLDKQIELGEKRKAEKSSLKYDEEANNLKALRDAKRKILDELVGKPELTEEQLIAKTENALDKQIEKVKKELAENDIEYKVKKDPVISDKINKQREELKALRDAKEVLRQESGIMEKKWLEQAKKTKVRLANSYKEKINNKDYAKKETKRRPIDDELIKLDMEMSDWKNKFLAGRHLVDLQNRTAYAKFLDGLAKTIGITRKFKATLEFSTILAQHGFLTVKYLVFKPKTFIEGIKRVGLSFVSPTKSEQYEAELKNSPLYPLMVKAKVPITSSDYKSQAVEEGFEGDFVDNLWTYIGNKLDKNSNDEKKLTLTGKIRKVIGKDIRPEDLKSKGQQFKDSAFWKMFERGSVAYGNYIKEVEFAEGVKLLNEAGYDPINDIEQYEKVASYIRVFSGRANLGKADLMSSFSSVFIFSLKFAVSTFQQLNPVFYSTLGDGSGKPTIAQKMAVKTFMTGVASLIGFSYAFVAMANQAKDDDEDEWYVETDPNSTNFMNIVNGEINYDLWHGTNKYITLFSRLITGKYKTSKGVVKEYGDGYKADTRQDALGNFITGKFSPSAGFAWKMLSTKKEVVDGKTYLVDNYGNVVSEKDVYQLFEPIYEQAFRGALKEDPNTFDGMLIIGGLFGVGVQPPFKRDKLSKPSVNILKVQKSKKLKTFRKF